MFFDDIQSFQKAIHQQRFAEAEQRELTEFIKKIIVHAPDKSSGHRRQKIEIVWNFIRELEQGEDEQAIERQRKSRTA